jgi:hypothetical protein
MPPYPPFAIAMGIGSVRKLSFVPSVEVNLICPIWLAYKTSDRSVRRIGDGRCLRGTRGIGNSITPPPEFGDQPVIRNEL